MKPLLRVLCILLTCSTTGLYILSTNVLVSALAVIYLSLCLGRSRTISNLSLYAWQRILDWALYQWINKNGDLTTCNKGSCNNKRKLPRTCSVCNVCRCGIWPWVNVTLSRLNAFIHLQIAISSTFGLCHFHLANRWCAPTSCSILDSIGSKCFSAGWLADKVWWNLVHGLLFAGPLADSLLASSYSL